LIRNIYKIRIEEESVEGVEGWRVVLYRQDFEKFSKISTIDFYAECIYAGGGKKEVSTLQPPATLHS